MAKNKLHPSIEKFKEFVRNNPHVIREVREGKLTLQELYEDWYLLGEDDPRWEQEGVKKKSAESEKKTDWISQFTNTLKNLDTNQVQGHINNLSQALGAIQGVISQFQGGTQQAQAPRPEPPKHPFLFRKD